VFLTASRGDVSLRQGPIDASGIDTGIGSDAGLFAITAGMAMRCAVSGAACTTDDDCAPGDHCTAAGGNVTIEDSLSAKGGAGTGSGCIACTIQGDGVVAITAPVGVGGGSRFGVGCTVTISADS